MLLNQKETLQLWNMLSDCILNCLKEINDDFLPDDIREDSKECLQLARKLKAFLEPVDTVYIEEGPF